MAISSLSADDRLRGLLRELFQKDDQHTYVETMLQRIVIEDLSRRGP